ncbi:MAG: hypothetical protein H0T76_12745 [Nannocystis sp.]|nr:hypothetical protein [Nannocystis sp.]MBA3547347.1 hypothetical protein [Nannocystis sp.]
MTLPVASSESSGYALQPLAGSKVTGLGRERGRAEQQVVSPVAQLILRPVDHRGLERPLGARDIGVVDQRDIGVELGLADLRAVLGHQVAAVLVVQHVGAEIGGPHDEARRAGLVGGE